MIIPTEETKLMKTAEDKAPPDFQAAPPLLATAVLPGTFQGQHCWIWVASGRHNPEPKFDPPWKSTVHGTQIKLPKSVLLSSGLRLIEGEHSLDGVMAKLPMTQVTTSLGARMAPEAGLVEGEHFAQLVTHSSVVRALAARYRPAMGGDQAKPSIDAWFTQAGALEGHWQRPHFGDIYREASGRFEMSASWLPVDGNIWGLLPGLMPGIDPWRESAVRLHLFPGDRPWKNSQPVHLLGTVPPSFLAPRFRWDFTREFTPSVEPEHNLGITADWAEVQSRSYGMTACLMGKTRVVETGDGVTVQPLTPEFQRRVGMGYFGPVLLAGYDPSTTPLEANVPQLREEAFELPEFPYTRSIGQSMWTVSKDGYAATYRGKFVYPLSEYNDRGRGGAVCACWPGFRPDRTWDNRVKQVVDCQAVPLADEDTSLLRPMADQALEQLAHLHSDQRRLLEPVPFKILPGVTSETGREKGGAKAADPLLALLRPSLHHIRGMRCVGLNVLDGLLHMATGVRPGWAAYHEEWHGFPSGVFGPFEAKAENWDQLWLVADIDAPGWAAAQENVSRAGQVCRISDRPIPYGRVDTNEMPYGSSVALTRARIAMAKRLGLKKWAKVEDYDFRVVIVVSRLGADGVREFDAFETTGNEVRKIRKEMKRSSAPLSSVVLQAWPEVEKGIRTIADSEFYLHAHEDETEHPSGILPPRLADQTDRIAAKKRNRAEEWCTEARAHLAELKPVETLGLDEIPLWFPYEPELRARHFSACVDKSPSFRRGFFDGWSPQADVELPLWITWAILWRYWAEGQLEDHPDKVWHAIFLNWTDAESMPRIALPYSFLKEYVLSLNETGKWVMNSDLRHALARGGDTGVEFWDQLHGVARAPMAYLRARLCWLGHRACEAVRDHSPFRFTWSHLPLPIKILGELPIWLLVPFYLLLRRGKGRWFEFDLVQSRARRVAEVMLSPLRIFTGDNLTYVYIAALVFMGLLSALLIAARPLLIVFGFRLLGEMAKALPTLLRIF